MKNFQPVWGLVLAILLLSGCMATITPSGDVYTEAFVPSTVVVESYTTPVFVSVPRRPAPRHLGPIVSGRRYPGHPHRGPAPHGHPRGPLGPGHRR